MSWTDRMKKTIETFKRMALPLFGFYIIFIIISSIMAALSIAAAIMPVLRSGEFSSSFPSSPYIDPTVPVPPGYDSMTNFGYGPSFGDGSFGELAPYLEELAPFMNMAPTILLSIALLVLLSILLASFFQAGVFHLTKKAYVEKAQFRDIRFQGFARILGWSAILMLMSIVMLSLGIVIAMRFQSEYAMASFAIIYMLVFVALGIFLAPWITSAPYRMLTQLHLPFGQAFKESWSFYRRHMGPLWGAFLTILGIQLLIGLFDNNASDVGLILSLIVTPFLMILPVVWVFTLEEEEKPIGNLYDDPTTPVLRPETSPFTVSTDSRYHPAYEGNKPTDAPSSAAPESPPNKPDAPDVPIASYPAPSNPYTPPKDPYSSPESPYDSPYNPSHPRIPLPVESEDTANFCPTCGRKTREGASYCSQCGTKL
ncbi:zinc-ribbon domain-containing protein [Desulfitobacterium sp. THU1]|uniref:zinc ribbon domain-containing protein n=1 Tax=Desulfitobacterium sp. THU1 TaxID=3138072 RepID=UPI00311EAC4C